MSGQSSMSKNQLNEQAGKVSLWLVIPLATIAFLIAFYLLFANTIIKSIAQSALGDASGAEVNIESLDHSLFPLGIDIQNIQFTDAAQPFRNKIAANRIQADVALMPLLSSKLIMENLVIDEITFDTARKAEGEVYRPATSSSGFAFPTLEDLPSVDEVLANSPLQTTAAITQAQETYQKYEQPLQEKYATLPEKEKIEEYKTQLKVIQEMDFNNPANIAKAKQMFDELKAQIQSDRDKVSEFVTLAKQAQGEVNASVLALKAAPAQDYALLKGLVAGDEAAIGQVSQHLFGDKAKLYTQALVAAADMLLNAKGDNAQEVPVVDDSGLPMVWIKNAEISVKWLDETIASTWSNITEQHALVGNPTTFKVDSTKANYWQAINLNGQFEILSGMVSATQNWNVAGLKLEDVTLIPEQAKQKLNAMLNSGLLDSKGSLSIVNNQLDGTSNFDLSQLALDAQGSNTLTNAIAAAISEQTSFNLTGKFYGDVSNPSIDLDSQFDKNLVASLGAGLAANPKLDELRQKLNAKMNSQLGTSGDQLDSVNALLGAAQGDSEALTSLLGAQLNNKVEEKKDELMNKLKNKLLND
jgi:uncharacterized protein (TIGR03545 family)